MDNFEEKFSHIKNFFKYEGKKEREDGLYQLTFSCVKCLPIKKSLKTLSSVPLSNLRTHLKSAHPKLKSDFENLTNSSPRPCKRPAKEEVENTPKKSKMDFFAPKKNTLTQKEFNMACLDYIIQRNEPLTIVEDSAFRELMSKCFNHGNENLHVPCYKTITKLLDWEYQKLKEELINELSKASSVGITTDGWSHVKKNYLGYTVTWFNNDLTRFVLSLGINRCIGKKRQYESSSRYL